MDERVYRTDVGSAPDTVSRETVAPARSRRGYWILTALIAAGLMGGAWYLWPRKATQPATAVATAGAPAGPAAAAQPVGFATIGKGGIRIVLNELGAVNSLDTISVVTQISGQIMRYGFTEGQLVKAGDFLAQIDPRPYQAALDSAQGTLVHDQGLLDQAKADLKRYVTLGRQDSIAQQQIEDQHFLVQQYTGAVQTDQGAVEAAQVNLVYCHIVSPVTGKIGLRQIDVGNYVSANGTGILAVVTQMQPISVIFSLPEDDLPRVIQRLGAGATLAVEAYDRSNNTLLERGEVSNLDNLINTSTGMLNIRATFQNPGYRLYPNQFVNVHLLVDTIADAVRVPVTAVQRGQQGTFVYLIAANNTVSVRPVTLGPTDGDFQAVTDGLQPGDRVVTDGTDRLREGALVSLPGAAKSAGKPDKPGAPDPQPGRQNSSRPQ